VALIPNDHQVYGEVFAGGAWVFFAKPESKCESINDLNSDLVTFYRVLQNHLEEFCRQFKWLLASREWWHDWNRQLIAGGLTDIQRAARYYYVQRHCFSGKIVGRTFGVSPERGPRINLLRLEEELSAVHLRLTRVLIENLTWEDYLSRYDKTHTFFYLDPPYWGFENLYGKGMFSRDDFHRLAEHFGGLKGRFIMSINDVPEIRQIFKQFSIKQVQTTYCTRKISQAATELLVMNY
jgi:DNA adenine methylase